MFPVCAHYSLQFSACPLPKKWLKDCENRDHSAEGLWKWGSNFFSLSLLHFQGSPITCHKVASLNTESSAGSVSHLVGLWDKATNRQTILMAVSGKFALNFELSDPHWNRKFNLCVQSRVKQHILWNDRHGTTCDSFSNSFGAVRTFCTPYIVPIILFQSRFRMLPCVLSHASLVSWLSADSESVQYCENQTTGLCA